MAITSLKNVEVTRLNRSGYGFGVKEQNESNGKTYTTYWTVVGEGRRRPAGWRPGERVRIPLDEGGRPEAGQRCVERRYVEQLAELAAHRTCRVRTAAGTAARLRPEHRPAAPVDTQAGNGGQTGAQGSWVTAGKYDDPTPF